MAGIFSGFSSRFERVATRIAASRRPGRGVQRLAAVRRQAADDILHLRRAASDRLADGLARGSQDARDALAELAAQALDDLRDRVALAGQRGDADLRLLCTLDAWWRTDGLELMDDPTLDPHRRAAVVAALDRFNRVTRIYDRTLDHVRPLLRPDGTRLMDLAAGHGGFALAVARTARSEGLRLQVTSTDLREEYLALGRHQSEAEALDVRFQIQDALDLSNLAAGEQDVITCSQALHHFPPGLVAVMFDAAARAAARGLVFVDGCRSAVNAVGLAAFGAAVVASPDFIHDSVLSQRRFFVPEELGLLARIGPVCRGASAAWAPPGHCVVTWIR